jgi:mRNA interferase RelE/StbE
VYEVLIERRAERDLDRLPSDIFTRVQSALLNLAKQPRPPGCRKLTGSQNDWRVRVGDYRIVYAIDDHACVVHINRVRHRREVYR